MDRTELRRAWPDEFREPGRKRVEHLPGMHYRGAHGSVAGAGAVFEARFEFTEQHIGRAHAEAQILLRDTKERPRLDDLPSAVVDVVRDYVGSMPHP